MPEPKYFTEDLPLAVIAELRDYHQIKNLLNGYTCAIKDETPVAQRLFRFFARTHDQDLERGRIIQDEWDEFNKGKEKL